MSDVKIMKLCSEFSNVRIEYEEDLRGKLVVFKEWISDFEDELSDECEKFVKVIVVVKFEVVGVIGDLVVIRVKIYDFEIEFAFTREEVIMLEDEIKLS